MSELFPEAAPKSRRRVDFIVPPTAGRATCLSCGASIAWVTTWRDGSGRPKKMPLDLSTVHHTPEGTDRAESHFAHCPDARRHRRQP